MTNETTQNESVLPSLHIYLLPFTYSHKIKNNLSFSDLWSSITSKLSGSSNLTNTIQWKQVSQEHPNKNTYAEYMYFHPFAQEALYDLENNDSIRHFEADLKGQEATYIIEIDNSESYKLNIEKIGLNLYSTGIGVLSMFCRSTKSLTPEEVLSINQFGRRIYQPYLGSKGKIVPSSIAIQIGDEKARKNNIVQVTERFEPPTAFSRIMRLPKHILSILPKRLIEDCHLASALDDRMFVLSWYANDGLAQRMKLAFSKSDLDARETDFLYRFTFVDRPGEWNRGVNNPSMQSDFLNRHTNLRWQEFKTFFGVCRYAFVALGNSGFKDLGNHVETMYFKMVELSLMQRASLIHFSTQIAGITHADSPRQRANKTAELNEAYLHFINNTYFTEITPQEQGIELYDMLRQHLRNTELAESLNQEVQELHNFVSLEEEKQRNKALDTLTVLGAMFVVPSFILAYFSLGLLNENLSPKDPGLFNFAFGGLAIVGISGVLANLFIRDIWTIKNRKISRGIGYSSLVIGTIVTILMLLYPSFFATDTKSKSKEKVVRPSQAPPILPDTTKQIQSIPQK